MKIKCPKCSSIFQVDDNLLTSIESKFRCYKCGYMWIVNLDKFKNQQSQSIIKNPQQRVVENNSSSFFNQKNSFWFIIIIITVLFSIISFVLISNRTSIARGLKKLSLPSITMSRKPSKTDLEIEIDKPVQSIKRDNKDLLLIKGRIINATNKKQSIPEVLIELKNKEKNILSHMIKKLDKESVAPNSSENFTFIVERYSKTIVSVEVNFDLSPKR
ncbi:MAG: zinc-ribbon domain-containing protein [Rickettsiales bacterium]|nr:zinc-ribbon domain-containing protein [Rickettsiales bacterium]